MSDTNSTDAKFAELHAGKILLAAFLISGVGTYLLNLMAAPVGLLAVPRPCRRPSARRSRRLLVTQAAIVLNGRE